MSSNSSTIAVGTTRNSSTKFREAALVFINRFIFHNKETNVGLSIFIFIYIEIMVEIMVTMVNKQKGNHGV